MIKEAGRLIVTGLTAGIMIGFTVLVILLAEASVKIPAGGP